MPRKSFAAKTMPALLVEEAKRPTPPKGLPPAARKVWQNVVASLPAGHFHPADLVLLEAMCRASAQKADADALVATEGLLLDGKAHPAAKLSAQLAGVLASLAGKLRLCPSSRTRPEAADLRNALAGRKAGRKPWDTHPQTDGDDDDRQDLH